MHPSSSSPTSDTAARCLSVRFEDACVLIPQACRAPSKSPLRPRIITKSYSLPLWKPSSPKKIVNTFHTLVSEVDEASNAGAPRKFPNADVERKAFSLTVSVPSLTTKTRRRAPSSPLSPCLSRRSVGLSHSPSPSSTPASTPLSSPSVSTPAASSSTLHRAPAFPQIQPATFTQAETVPLRPCCEACHRCVDAALAGGESWSERWSRGAVRRYSEGEHVHLHAPLTSAFGVTRTPASVCDEDMPLLDALTIDEVDVKRRSDNYSRALLNNHHVPPPSAATDADSDEEDICQEVTAEVMAEVTAPDTLLPQALAAIVQQEDEDMLFPLPSPRRTPTPNQSPTQTPMGSQVNLTTSPSGSQTNFGPSGSQTNLGPSGSQVNLSAPVVSSPLASKSIISPVPVVQSSPPILSSSLPLPVLPAESVPKPRPPRSISSSPVYRRQRSMSPVDTRSAIPRRPSFSTASETFLKGSVSMLKGVAAGFSSGPSNGVGIMH